jgi:hypothetical protein
VGGVLLKCDKDADEASPEVKESNLVTNVARARRSSSSCCRAYNNTTTPISYQLRLSARKNNTDLFLFFESTCKLRCPFIRFLAFCFHSGKSPTPFTFDILAHRTQRCAEVILVALDDHLELADIPCLFSKQAILLALWCIGRQLGPREERFFERKNLRRLGFDLASRGKEFLLELSVCGSCVSALEPFWEKEGKGRSRTW